MTPNIHYENREMEGERLELPKGAIYWLGPNVTFRRCTLVISVASRWLTLMSGNMIDCTIQAKSALNTLRWATMNLKGCRFKGRFTGNDFGFREDPIDKWKIGGIEDCDFSEARLHGCRFFNCDMNTVRLPRWPCFTFMDPCRHATELGRREWPGLFGQVVIQGLAKDLDGVVAVSWYAPTIAEQLDTTAEELRTLLEREPCVVM
ncbi:hypothetical protein F0U60_30660 [Archangium minus]|uniref:Pentapeptide repeat-containing protein n=1 Tax=Archangium minus TaxID=83450 RepID=A0ABY9WXZ3_9BACT|nr:hypothetical protein F0U60_30660 [Archangium minus]